MFEPTTLIFDTRTHRDLLGDLMFHVTSIRWVDVVET